MRRGPRRALPAVALALAACAGPTPPAVDPPSFYARLDEPGAALDAAGLVGLVNTYRGAKGLPPLALDAGLTAEAASAADRLADADRSRAGETPRIEAVSAGDGRVERASAGYRTAAEAFSGWRDSPPHNAALVAPGARRIGVAVAARPASRYRVYWGLVTAP